MHILMTGATGFIGSELIKSLQADSHTITVLTRNKASVIHNVFQIYESLEDIPSDSIFDVVINLAGAPISKRWTPSYKKILIESRLHITRSLHALIQRLSVKPTKVISVSAIGYYGRQDHKALDEHSIPYNEFTHQLCDLWEKEALKMQSPHTQVMIARLGIVLGLGQGILKQTLPLFKMCLGGKIGSGRQYMSWIHIHDAVRAFKFLLNHTLTPSIYNITSPAAVTNQQWTEILSQALGRPALLPLPDCIITTFFGEMGEALLLHGQKVLPSSLENARFTFVFPDLKEALADLIHRK